ncbi:hypothetical protein [Nostoc sp. FACHB-145]|uniref:hypothetical protein n=1 Tax=Nostoc sp. FACHB-145 TaxID=2692836 RepID=UPI0016897E9A|nr:hypothetical protein [Nostoc sp. FACHB-145]MBD2469090.1 hypothetical protein [Nostoc sp. FACHB-145]
MDINSINTNYSGTNSLSSDSSLFNSLDPFAYQLLPNNSLMLLGTDKAENLYLKVGDGQVLEYSADGNYFYQINGLGFSQDTNISVNLGFDKDSLYIDSSLFDTLKNTGAKLNFEGGQGNDTLFGPKIDTTWYITGDNSGNIGNIEFHNVENLKAAANNYATFVFTPEGNLSGVADGGDGNLGTLVLEGGTYNSAKFIADGPHSGEILLDTKTIRYDGLAPIFDNTTTADRVFTATNSNDKILVKKDTIGKTTIFSSNGTFESITFWNPSNSLTIKGLLGNDTITVDSIDANFTKSLTIDGEDGNDSVIFAQNLTLNGGNLTVNAESISILDNVNIFTSGDVSFEAKNNSSVLLNLLPGGIVNTQKAEISLGNNVSIEAENITLKAEAQDDNPTDEINSWVNGFLVQPLIDYGTAIASLPVDFAIRESSASVILGNNAKLTTGGDIEISATAKADSTSKVLNQYFSIGYSSSNATAITTIGQGAIIKAEGDVNILSDANSVAGMTTRTLKNLGEEPTDSTGVGVSIAIANAKLTSKTTVSQGAEIEAGGNVNLVANGKTEREASAEVGSFGSSGRGGISAALGFSKADVNTFVNGKVVSGSSLQHEFNPGSAVNNDNDTITIKNHGFKDGQAVIYKNNNDADSNIGDLEDSTTYYVKVVDENTIQLAESSSDLEDEKFIDLKSTGVQGNAHILKDPGIRVIAQLESEDAADATSGVGGDPSIADKIEKPEIAVSAIIGKLTEDNYSKNSNSGGSGGDASVTAAGAFVFSKIDNNVTATIGSNAVLESQADVSVQASISENIKTAAEAATEDAEGSNGAAKKASASAAVIVGLYSNNAQTTIESNAVIDASKDTRITSEVSYPFRIEPQERFVPSDVGAMLKEEGFGGVTGYLDGKLGIQSELLNSWAVSTSETEGEISLAGSVNYQQFTNNSQAIVKSGAKINQNQDIRPESDDQTVSVEATTEMQLINVTGVFKFDLSIDSVKDLVQKKDPLAIYNPVGSSGGKGGVGGAFFLMFNDSTTIAKVETGTSIYTGADGGLTINAESTAFDVDLGQAGGGGGKFGVGGTFSYTNQESKTIAQLESGAKVTGGSLEITANDETLRITAVGGVAKSENLGIGMSVTVNEMDRETLALIGNQTGTAGIGTDIEVEGDIKVEAKADGGLWAFSLAAAVVKDKPPEKPSEASTDQLASAPQPDLSSAGGSGGSTSSNDQGNQGKSGIGISGDVSINNVKDKVSAYINDAGTIKGETLDITAVNDSDLRSVSGAVSFSAKKDPNSTSAGIAGSFSMNTLTGTTSAYISGSAANGDKLTLEASQLSLSATRSGDLFALSAGGAAAPGQNGYAVSGSVSLNKIANTTEASMSGTNATIAGDVGLNAQDSSSIFAIGGALSFGGKAGFGAAIGLNRINNTTKALIQDSSLDHQGKLELSAINESSIKAITASLGISTQQSSAAGAGTVSLNFISNRTETAIINTQKGASTATGIISLIAKDNSDIANLAGAVGLSGGKAGFGAAVAYNSISNVVKSYIESSTLSTQGELKLQAESKAVIQAIALGVGGGKDVGLGGSVAINLIGNTTEAYLNSVNLTADGQNNISASDNSTIQALAGGVGVGQKAGIGAGIGVNQIGNSIKAYVSNSNLTSNNLVSLSALSTSTIEAISIGGGGSEKFALGGSVSVNTINTVTTAYISNNSVVQGSQVLASALDTSTIKSLSGAVAVSGNTAIGAAVSTNNINNQVVTYISSSQVTATSNNILLKADLKAKISNATLGGAGGQSFALGGSVSVNNINTVTDAHISDNATVNAAQAVEVLANDNSEIESLAGQVAIGGKAGIGAAVSTNNINNKVSADISSSQITSTTGGVKVKAAIAPKINNITVAGAGGESFALGGSVSVNNIGTQTLAYISNNSTVEASQGVTVLATDNSNINSFAGTIAGSGNTAIGASVSTNNVNNKVSAYISASQVTSTSNVLVNADLTALVRNATVGGAGAGTFAAGGSVSVNNIGTVTEADISNGATVNAAQAVEVLANDNSDIESLAGQVAIGGTAGVGAAVSTNNINNNVSADISSSQITSTIGGVKVKAAIAPKINNITVAGAGGGSFALGGSVTVNNIGTQTLAYISNNSTVEASQGVTVLATDNSNINSFAGTIAGSGNTAIGASVSTNNVNNKVSAYISASQVTSTSNVLVNAGLTALVRNATVGGAGAGTFAAGGSVTVNNIGTVTEAYISDKATVNAAQEVEILANDNSDIESLAGQVVIGGAAGVGASVSTNNVNNKTSAYISDSQVTSSNSSLTVKANSSPKISNITAGGTGGGAFAFGGSVTVNNIGTQTLAYISNNSIIQARQNIEILATNNAAIQSLAGQISAAGQAAIGAAVAVNNYGGKIEAYINDSEATSTSGQIKVTANDTSKIESLSAGASVSGSPAVPSVSLTGSVSVNNISNTVDAHTLNARISANSLEISAKNDATIKSLAGQISISISGGAVGAAVAYNNIGSTVKAYIAADDGNYTTVNTSGNVLVTAVSKGTIETIAAGGSVGLFVGAAGSAAVNQMTNNVSAFVQNGIIKANGSVGILADSNNTMTTKGGTFSGGFVGLGATIAVNNLENKTRAYVNNSSIDGVGEQSIIIPKTDGTGVTESFQGVAVLATSKDNLGVTIGTGGAGGYAFVASIAVNTFKNTTEAYANDVAINAIFGSTVPQHNVYIKAFNDSKVEVNAGTAGVGLAAAAGVGIEVTTMKNATNAYINSSDLINSQGSQIYAHNNLIVEAKTQKSLTSNVMALGGGLGFSVQGAVSIINVSSGMSDKGKEAASDTQSKVDTQLQDLNKMGKDSSGKSNISTKSADFTSSLLNLQGTTAFIAGTANAGNNIIVNAYETTKLNMTVGSLSAGLASVGGAVGIANIQHNASAYVGDRSTLIGGNITIQSTGFVDSTTVEAVAGSAGLVGLGAAVAILSSENNSKAYVGNHTAIIKANNIDVIANSSSNLNVEGLGASYGLAAAGAVIANAQETGTTKAYLDSGIQVENTDNLNVKANTNETVTATTQASSGGIISGNGTDAKATVNPNVAAYIGDNNTIKVTKDINVLSNVSVDGDAASKGGSYGALAVGLSFSEVNSNPTINTYVGANTTIEAGNITISSSLGKAPVSADTSFNPSNAVNNTADSITFANNHGLKTGDTVVYSNGGGNTIGGLTNQTSYKVIAVNDKTVKFGSEFDATTIDTKLNTLKFANGHNFTNNQQVIYEASSGTSNIGGLTSGQKYYVKVIDSNTVQLSKTPIIDDVNEGAKLAGINTVGGVTTITARKDDKTANVFQNGDTVVYKKRSALFTVDTTVPDTGGKANIFNLSTGDIVSQDTINSASHGFETGDQVIYSATGTALSGLTNGQKYYVIKVDDNKFQLGTTYNQATNTVTGIVDITNATAGTSHKITTVGLKISNVTNFTYSTANSNKITVTNHSFTTGQAVKYSGVSSIGLTNGTTYYVIKVDDNNFQLAATSSGTALTLNAGAGSYSLTATTELEENVTYYVKNSTLSDFQLSKTNGGSAIALDTSGLTGTGASHIFVKQSVIDLSSASTGIHNLHLDLENGTATGDKHLLSSGASVVLPSQGDQVFSAYSQASAGALLGGTGTRTNLNITPTSKTYIGNNASLTALGNVTVKSLSNIQVTGATTSETYGAIAVGASEINLTVNTTNNTYVGNAAKIQAQGNVIINAQSDNNLNISASGGAGSLITFADADAIARLKHDTTTTVQDNATIIANDDLVIGSNSNTNGNVKVQASGVGFYADADANGEFYIDGTNRTDINSNAHLEGRTLTIEAIVNNLNVETRSEAEGAGLIGNIDAHSKVELSGTDATVNIGSQAYLKGDYINLNAIYKKVSSNAIAFADCDGLGGDTDSDSRNNMPLSAKVITDSTSTLDVYKLNVKSDLESVSYRTDAHSDKAWELRIWTPFGDIVITMDFGSESKNETFAPTATTNFNSYVNFVARGENPVLVIGTDGQVTQKSNNVTVNFSGNNAIVSDIKTTELGEANFKGSLTDNGKYSIKDPAYDTVQIDNYSANNLIINNIDAINLGAASQFKYIVNGSSTNKSINGSLPINSTLVTINNWGTSNLILQGKIKNPHDRTILYSGGNIFRQGTTQNIVTRDLKMTAAGSIGAINQGIAAELNQGYSPVTANVADSNIYLNVEAQNSTYLNLTAKALDKKPVTVNVQRMTGYTGEVNLEIGQTTDQANAAVNALYQFTDNIDFYQSIMAGNNIVINAGNTTTNINAKTIFTGATGSLNMVTGGWINVNNVTAAINLQKVISYQDAVHLNGWDLTLVDNGLLQAAKDISVTSTNFSMLNNAQLKAKTDVSLLVNNSFQISASSLISDANNVVIQGDYNNQNPAGATINIEGWINAQQMSIITQGNNDIVNIQRLATTTNIYTGGGNDIVNIGSSQNRTNEIQKRLTIYGETQDDLDTLNIDNSGDNSNNVGILTDTSLTGLSTGEGIYYNGFEVLNLKLGIGNDDFTILNTSATTNIDSSSGDDKFRIGTKVDASGSVVDEIVNGVLLPGVNILGTKNITNIKTGTGNDYIQVNRNTAVLNIEGEFGDDTFEVNTPINYSILLNNAQVNLSGNDGNDTTIINGSSLLETINNNGSSVEVVNSRLISLMTNENLVINGNIGSTGSSGGSNNTNSGSDPTLSSLADRTLVTTNTTNTGSNSSLTLLSLFDRNLVNTSSTSTGTGSVIDPLLLALFSR